MCEEMDDVLVENCLFIVCLFIPSLRMISNSINSCNNRTGCLDAFFRISDLLFSFDTMRNNHLCRWCYVLFFISCKLFVSCDWLLTKKERFSCHWNLVFFLTCSDGKGFGGRGGGGGFKGGSRGGGSWGGSKGSGTFGGSSNSRGGGYNNMGKP